MRCETLQRQLDCSTSELAAAQEREHTALHECLELSNRLESLSNELHDMREDEQHSATAREALVLSRYHDLEEQLRAARLVEDKCMEQEQAAQHIATDLAEQLAEAEQWIAAAQEREEASLCRISALEGGLVDARDELAALSAKDLASVDHCGALETELMQLQEHLRSAEAAHVQERDDLSAALSTEKTKVEANSREKEYVEQRCKSLQSDLDARACNFATLQQRCHELEGAVEDTEAQRKCTVEVLEARIRETQGHAKALQEQIGTLKTQMAAANARAEVLLERGEAERAEVSRWMEQQGDFNEGLKELWERDRRAQERCTAMEIDAAISLMHLRDVQSHASKLESELWEAEQSANAKAAASTARERTITHLRGERQTLEKRVEELEAEHGAVMQSESASREAERIAAARAQELEEMLDEAWSQCSRLEALNTEMQQRVAALEAREASARQQRLGLELQLNKAAHQAGMLEACSSTAQERAASLELSLAEAYKILEATESSDAVLRESCQGLVAKLEAAQCEQQAAEAAATLAAQAEAEAMERCASLEQQLEAERLRCRCLRTPQGASAPCCAQCVHTEELVVLVEALHALCRDSESEVAEHAKLELLLKQLMAALQPQVQTSKPQEGAVAEGFPQVLTAAGAYDRNAGHECIIMQGSSWEDRGHKDRLAELHVELEKVHALLLVEQNARAEAESREQAVLLEHDTMHKRVAAAEMSHHQAANTCTAPQEEPRAVQCCVCDQLTLKNSEQVGLQARVAELEQMLQESGGSGQRVANGTLKRRRSYSVQVETTGPPWSVPSSQSIFKPVSTELFGCILSTKRERTPLAELSTNSLHKTGTDVSPKLQQLQQPCSDVGPTTLTPAMPLKLDIATASFLAKEVPREIDCSRDAVSPVQAACLLDATHEMVKEHSDCEQSVSRAKAAEPKLRLSCCGSADLFVDVGSEIMANTQDASRCPTPHEHAHKQRSVSVAELEQVQFTSPVAARDRVIELLEADHKKCDVREAVEVLQARLTEAQAQCSVIQAQLLESVAQTVTANAFIAVFRRREIDLAIASESATAIKVELEEERKREQNALATSAASSLAAQEDARELKGQLALAIAERDVLVADVAASMEARATLVETERIRAVNSCAAVGSELVTEVALLLMELTMLVQDEARRDAAMVAKQEAAALERLSVCLVRALDMSFTEASGLCRALKAESATVQKMQAQLKVAEDHACALAVQVVALEQQATDAGGKCTELEVLQAAYDRLSEDHVAVTESQSDFQANSVLVTSELQAMYATHSSLQSEYAKAMTEAVSLRADIQEALQHLADEQKVSGQLCRERDACMEELKKLNGSCDSLQRLKCELELELGALRGEMQQLHIERHLATLAGAPQELCALEGRHQPLLQQKMEGDATCEGMSIASANIQQEVSLLQAPYKCLFSERQTAEALLGDINVNATVAQQSSQATKGSSELCNAAVIKIAVMLEGHQRLCDGQIEQCRCSRAACVEMDGLQEAHEQLHVQFAAVSDELGALRQSQVAIHDLEAFQARHIHLQEEHRTALQNLHELRAECERLQQEAATASDTSHRHRLEYGQLQREHAVKSDALQMLQQERDLAVDEMQQVQVRYEALCKKHHAGAQELARLQLASAMASVEVVELDASHQRLATDYSMALSEKDEMKVEWDLLRRSEEAALAELDEAHVRSEDLREAKAALEVQVGSMHAECERLQEEHQEARRQLTVIHEERGTLQEQHQGSMNQLRVLYGVRETLQKAQEAMALQLEHTRAERDECKEQLAAAAEEVGSLCWECERLKEKEKEAVEQCESARSEGVQLRNAQASTIEELRCMQAEMDDLVVTKEAVSLKVGLLVAAREQTCKDLSIATMEIETCCTHEQEVSAELLAQRSACDALSSKVAASTRRLLVLCANKGEASAELQAVHSDCDTLAKNLEIATAELESLLAGYKLQEGQLLAAAAQVESLQVNVGTASKHSNTLWSVQRQLEQKYDQVSAKLQVVLDEQKRLQQEHAAASEEMQSKSSELKWLQQEHAATVKELQSVLANHKHLQQELVAVSEKSQAMLAEQELLQQEHEVASAKLQTAMVEHEQLHQKHNATSMEHQRVIAERDRLQCELGAVAAQLSELRDGHESLRLEHTSVTSSVKVATDAALALQFENEQLQVQQEFALSELHELQLAHGQLKQKHDDVCAELWELRGNCEQLRLEHASATSELEARTCASPTAAKELNALQSEHNRLRGLHEAMVFEMQKEQAASMCTAQQMRALQSAHDRLQVQLEEMSGTVQREQATHVKAVEDHDVLAERLQALEQSHCAAAEAAKDAYQQLRDKYDDAGAQVKALRASKVADAEQLAAAFHATEASAAEVEALRESKAADAELLVAAHAAAEARTAEVKGLQECKAADEERLKVALNAAEVCAAEVEALRASKAADEERLRAELKSVEARAAEVEALQASNAERFAVVRDALEARTAELEALRVNKAADAERLAAAVDAAEARAAEVATIADAVRRENTALIVREAEASAATKAATECDEGLHKENVVLREQVKALHVQVIKAEGAAQQRMREFLEDMAQVAMLAERKAEELEEMQKKLAAADAAVIQSSERSAELTVEVQQLVVSTAELAARLKVAQAAELRSKHAESTLRDRVEAVEAVLARKAEELERIQREFDGRVVLAGMHFEKQSAGYIAAYQKLEERALAVETTLAEDVAEAAATMEANEGRLQAQLDNAAVEQGLLQDRLRAAEAEARIASEKRLSAEARAADSESVAEKLQAAEAYGGKLAADMDVVQECLAEAEGRAAGLSEKLTAAERSRGSLLAKLQDEQRLREAMAGELTASQGCLADAEERSESVSQALAIAKATHVDRVQQLEQQLELAAANCEQLERRIAVTETASEESSRAQRDLGACLSEKHTQVMEALSTLKASADRVAQQDSELMVARATIAANVGMLAGQGSELRELQGRAEASAIEAAEAIAQVAVLRRGSAEKDELVRSLREQLAEQQSCMLLQMAALEVCLQIVLVLLIGWHSCNFDTLLSLIVSVINVELAEHPSYCWSLL
jgi:chromosome segregation ATPase